MAALETTSPRSEKNPAPRSTGEPRWRSLARSLLIPLLSVFTALVVSGIIIALTGGNPFLAYLGLWQGAFGSPRAISETLVWTTPYIFAGLGVALAFKGGLFNIGADGQLVVGAVAAAWIGYFLPRTLGLDLPTVIHLPLTIVGGGIAGGIWGAIPGYLKARFGANEVINTIMMNYIALLGASYLLNGVMKDPSPSNVLARTPLIALSARLSPLMADYRVHWGLILALLAAVAVWFLLHRTTLGFSIRTVGASPDAARYSGINYRRVIVTTMALSGFLAGLAGTIEVVGLNYRHDLSFSSGYGFDSITVALLGHNEPLGVVLSSLLFGAMRNGASRMQFMAQIPVDIISVVQALILLFVSANQIIRYIYRIRAPGDQLNLTRWGGNS